jgi:hypothetical protein
MKAIQPTERYFDASLGVMVNIYEEKKVKRKAWMRGEGMACAKMRIPEDDDRMFVRFKRKNGKY